MEESTKANGNKTTCMEKVNTLGRMEECIKEIILWIKSMDLEYINGLMEEYIKVSGIMGSNTAKAFIRFQSNSLRKVFGKMEKE